VEVDLIRRVEAHLVQHGQALVELRRHLHRNPELSHQEFETTRYLVGRLREMGLSPEIREEGTGFYADLTPDGFDPKRHRTVGIRCDLDALPILEKTDVPFASEREGVMHACGHDVHMTMVTGVADAFRDCRNELPGRIRLIYQHAEEALPGGAADMVRFGVMDGVDGVLGVHVDPELPVGQVGVRWGPFTAAFDAFEIRIIGKSGHGARPHHCVDPIYVTTHLLQAFYSSIGREFDARDPMVLTIGSIHGGSAENIIPDVVTLEGTIRTLSEDARAQVEPLLHRLSNGVCQTHGARYELALFRGAPAIMNDPAMVEAIATEGERLLGKDNVYWIPRPSMGAEDFSFYGLKAPCAMFRLRIKGAQESHFLHSAKFDIDERAILIGTRMLARSALRLLTSDALPSPDDE
jgi:amidohydrolase